MAAPSEVLGRRIAAALIDLLVALGIFIAVGIVSGNAYSHGGSVGVNLQGVSAVVYAVLVIAYYVLTESATGRTLGKALLGLRVVRAGTGEPPSTSAIVIRTLLRVVDFLPFLYFVGFITILITGARAQRLGDLAARTTVVGVSR
ncbi:MAG: RDD family protein [Solirubrobacteraceae bacterium]